MAGRLSCIRLIILLGLGLELPLYGLRLWMGSIFIFICRGNSYTNLNFCIYGNATFTLDGPAKWVPPDNVNMQWVLPLKPPLLKTDVTFLFLKVSYLGSAKVKFHFIRFQLPYVVKYTGNTAENSRTSRISEMYWNSGIISTGKTASFSTTSSRIVPAETMAPIALAGLPIGIRIISILCSWLDSRKFDNSFWLRYPWPLHTFSISCNNSVSYFSDTVVMVSEAFGFLQLNKDTRLSLFIALLDMSDKMHSVPDGPRRKDCLAAEFCAIVELLHAPNTTDLRPFCISCFMSKPVLVCMSSSAN